ncbi:hypothetical protein FB451DRAFT_1198186 [Mycena latifolia]|nr:hypothetical protein FB451DRAFT_1198186 [Mycena latifolia]
MASQTQESCHHLAGGPAAADITATEAREDAKEKKELALANDVVVPPKTCRRSQCFQPPNKLPIYMCGLGIVIENRPQNRLAKWVGQDSEPPREPPSKPTLKPPENRYSDCP